MRPAACPPCLASKWWARHRTRRRAPMPLPTLRVRIASLLLGSFALQIAFDLRVRHQDRRDEGDRAYEGDVPVKVRLRAAVLEPERDIFRRAAEDGVGDRICEADAHRAYLRWKHLRLHEPADRGVKRYDGQRHHDQEISRDRALDVGDRI